MKRQDLGEGKQQKQAVFPREHEKSVDIIGMVSLRKTHNNNSTTCHEGKTFVATGRNLRVDPSQSGLPAKPSCRSTSQLRGGVPTLRRGRAVTRHLGQRREPTPGGAPQLPLIVKFAVIRLMTAIPLGKEDERCGAGGIFNQEVEIQEKELCSKEALMPVTNITDTSEDV